VLFQGFCVDGGVPGGAVGVGGLLQFQQRADGLPRPDHVVFGAGLGDRGQLSQQVGIAQSVPGHAVVAVIGLPGVVAGNAGERRQHPGRVHAFGPAPGMGGDQRELAGRGGVHPGQRPCHPESGLIEVRDLRGEESVPWKCRKR
jgi:hypothetical protein